MELSVTGREGPGSGSSRWALPADFRPPTVTVRGLAPSKKNITKMSKKAGKLATQMADVVEKATERAEAVVLDATLQPWLEKSNKSLSNESVDEAPHNGAGSPEKKGSSNKAAAGAAATRRDNSAVLESSGPPTSLPSPSAADVSASRASALASTTALRASSKQSLGGSSAGGSSVGLRSWPSSGALEAGGAEGGAGPWVVVEAPQRPWNVMSTKKVQSSTPAASSSATPKSPDLGTAPPGTSAADWKSRLQKASAATSATTLDNAQPAKLGRAAEDTSDLPWPWGNARAVSGERETPSRKAAQHGAPDTSDLPWPWGTARAVSGEHEPLALERPAESLPADECPGAKASKTSKGFPKSSSAHEEQHLLKKTAAAEDDDDFRQQQRQAPSGGACSCLRKLLGISTAASYAPVSGSAP